MLCLPTTATAPFCPSEVRGSIAINPALLVWWRKLLRYAGPGLLVSAGYMDPGNWGTDIEGGSRFGFQLLWLLAELSIAACDLAEVLGCALAFHLLFGVSIVTGVLLTAADTVIVLGLKDNGFRRLEAIMLALIGTIAACFLAKLLLARPEIPAVLAGLVPRLHTLHDPQAIYLAVGILGATMMPQICTCTRRSCGPAW